MDAILKGERFDGAPDFEEMRRLFDIRAAVTCGTEVVIADYNIERELPLNEPVVVEFTPNKAGDIGFACGMNMLHGKIMVK